MKWKYGRPTEPGYYLVYRAEWPYVIRVFQEEFLKYEIYGNVGNHFYVDFMPNFRFCKIEKL